MFKKLSHSLSIPRWLFILLAAIFVLRIPSFFEPYSYGDEMIYLTLGEAVKRGIPLYKGIHDNKPPLLYIMAAFAGSLFWFKAILAVWNLSTIFVFWKLTEALFPKNQKAQKLATIIFAILTTLPLLEGNIINAELFMIGPIILAFLIFLSKKTSPKNLLLTGILFSIATLFKVPAAFDILTIVFLWIVAMSKVDGKNLRQFSKNTLFLFVGFALPLTLTFVWYFLRGALNEYFTAAFLQNVGYLSSWRPGDVQKPFLVKNLPLLARASVVGLGLSILYVARRKLSKGFLFATSWLLFSLFAVTLSERPYPHYLIQSVAPISLLLTFLFTSTKREQVFSIIPLTLAFLVPVAFKFWYYPTTSYYLRFIKLATGQVSQQKYLETFGSNVARNYKIADFLLGATRLKDSIFVWGDSPPIYALTRRLPPIKYVADYHIKEFASNKEIVETLSSNLPSYIIILPDTPPPSQLNSILQRNYALIETIEGAQIWKLLSPQVRALLSQ